EQPSITIHPSPPLVPVAAPNIAATKPYNRPAIDPATAQPGDTIKYTVTISNTGMSDATVVIFTDTIDPNTTLIAGSVVLAGDDDYNTIGDVQISVAAPGLLANDIGTGITASGGTTSAQGGTVTINSDGSFTYDPAVGFTGNDTFTYTATSG